ncbi:hypothetical protein F0256_24215 [Vibrio europaeus]|nr:hypothetical protein [Vibrio europaeus]
MCFGSRAVQCTFSFETNTAFQVGTLASNSTFFVAANKLLKTDYQRSAILVLVWYSVYGG